MIWIAIGVFLILIGDFLFGGLLIAIGLLRVGRRIRAHRQREAGMPQTAGGSGGTVAQSDPSYGDVPAKDPERPVTAGLPAEPAPVEASVEPLDVQEDDLAAALERDPSYNPYARED